jgi:hypothetical protein
MYNETDFDFTKSIKVIGVGYRYVIHTGVFDGEPILHPGEVTTPQGNILFKGVNPGTPLTDYENNIINGTGLVFVNFKDSSLQSIKNDGESVIIINSCDVINAKFINEKIMKLTDNRGSLFLDKEQLLKIIDYSYELGRELFLHLFIDINKYL